MRVLFEKFLLATNEILYDLPPKTKIGPFNIIVLTHKGLLFPFVFFLVHFYQNYSPGMLVYAAFHLSYALIWVLKDRCILNGTSFQTPTSIGSIIILIPLSFATYYWLPWLMASGHANQNPGPASISLAFFLFAVGIFYMIGSEAEKNSILRLKKVLVTSGLYSNTRNPNYFGEMMVYFSFAVILGVWFVYFYLLSVWILTLGPFICAKEESLRKKDGFKAYEKQSNLIIPKIFRNNLYNWGLYLAIFGLFGFWLRNDKF